MGLDSTDLILNLEAEFGVLIPDERYGEIRTVGDLYRFILEVTHDRQPEDVWGRLQDVFIQTLNVKREEVIPTARFIEDLGMD